MAARNPLLKAPPYQVESALKTLGAHLRTARLRRGLTIEEVASKIGTSRYVVADAEKGKPSTGIAVYVALLWAYGLTEQVMNLANPATDEEGLSLSLMNERERARPRKGLNNDF